MLKITARPNDVPAMLEALAMVTFQAKLDRACIDCQSYAETGNPQSLLYLEQWSTLKDLELQLRSQRFATLLAIMETAAEPPKLEVRSVAEQRGLEYVRSVRLGSSTTKLPHPSE